MAGSIKPLDPDMRQQLAAMLSGDAKAGSVRADLVRGLLGSQTGDDSGLVGMTPLGAAFDVSAANRDQRQGGSGLGHTLSAAAGMIPGAGPEARMIEHQVATEAGEHGASAISQALQYAKDDLTDALGSVPKGVKIVHKGVEDEADGQLFHNLEIQGLTPQQELKFNLFHDNTTPEEAYEASRMPKTQGIRAQLEAASKNDDKGATVVDAKTPPTVSGVDTSISDAVHPQKITPAKVLQSGPKHTTNHTPDNPESLPEGVHYDPNTDTALIEGMPHHFIYETDNGFGAAKGNPDTMDIEKDLGEHSTIADAHKAVLEDALKPGARTRPTQ